MKRPRPRSDARRRGAVLCGGSVALAVLLAACNPDPPAARPPAEAPAHERTRDLDVQWVGDPDADAPLVVLLHGFGAPGDDLVPLARALRGRIETPIRIVLPAAPITLGGRGRAWWRIEDFGRDRPADRGDESPAGLAEARRDVIALLEGLRREGRLDPERTVIGGFSQGAMLAADVALSWGAEPAGLAMMSGGPVEEPRWRRRMAQRTFPVFLSHGQRDPLLSFDAAERLRGAFAEHGHSVTFVPFDGGHTIPPPAIEGLRAFLARIR